MVRVKWSPFVRSAVKPEWSCLSGLPLRPGRKESIPIRHLDFRKTLGVHDVVLFDDFIAIEQKGGHSIHLVGAERSFLFWRHGTVDIVPDRRRKRPVTPHGPHGVRGVERAFAA